MKLYNLCNKKEYEECQKLTKFNLTTFEHLLKTYYFCYVNNLIQSHNLDGPSTQLTTTFDNMPGLRYYINDKCYDEKDYWNHPDVIQYQYLKQHPELEGFV